MKNYITFLAILLVGLVSTNTALADVKIKIRQTMSGQTYENTTYIKGKRQRAEQNMGAMQTVNITQCDLKRGIQIMPQAQTFMINLWEQVPSVMPSTATTQTKQSSTTEKGGVVTMTVTTKDTGERRQMFGYTARHLIITMESESSPDACTPFKSKMQIVGWYIDAAFALDCDTNSYRNYRAPNQKSGCQDRFQTKQIGTAKRGYPLYEKMTMFDESGKESSSFTNEVVELSNTTLDAALFDVPAGFREVKDSSELYASMASQNSSSLNSQNRNNSSMSPSGNSDSPGNTSAMSQNVKNLTAKSSSNTFAEVDAKKAGIIRIGLAAVRTGAVGEGINAADLAAAIQNSLPQYLKGTKIEIVQLEAKLQSASDAEAKQKECDYVLNLTVSHKKGGGGFGGFGKGLGGVIAQTGGGAWGNTAANVTGAVAVNAISAAALSQNVKSKDEITLDVKLTKDGAQTLAKQFKAKAKGDGDDIISQVIEQAAGALVEAAK